MKDSLRHIPASKSVVESDTSGKSRYRFDFANRRLRGLRPDRFAAAIRPVATPFASVFLPSSTSIQNSARHGWQLSRLTTSRRLQCLQSFLRAGLLRATIPGCLRTC
jgi:hypothetical protein